MGKHDQIWLWLALIFFVLAFFPVTIKVGAWEFKPQWQWGAFAFIAAAVISGPPW